MFRYAIVASLLVISASPAVAKDAEAAKASTPDPNKVVCRREVPTGSVMAKKVCRTRAQWDAIAEQSQEDLRQSQDVDRARSHTSMSRPG